ncbi:MULTISPECIES: hypothetical protein [Pseudomonas]|uniref:hypothetical protein n=1 Tax=Pseudomonas TaxID=286 RepID=UPI000A8938B5|nr:MULTISPECIES: hypothetical protein [Pseudomonas]
MSEFPTLATPRLRLRELQDLGFKAEGTLREAGFWNGQRHDLTALGLLVRECLDK